MSRPKEGNCCIVLKIAWETFQMFPEFTENHSNVTQNNGGKPYKSEFDSRKTHINAFRTGV